jgi:bifunctional DNA-binding transcriptional regulator/antitoxin component of YhaV-PrlF toxin-antitoxin module
MEKFTFVGKVIKVGNSYAVTIPKKIVNLYGIKAGDVAMARFELPRKSKKLDVQAPIIEKPLIDGEYAAFKKQYHHTLKNLAKS